MPEFHRQSKRSISVRLTSAEALEGRVLLAADTAGAPAGEPAALESYPAEVYGFVFHDRDANGSYTAYPDTPLPGATVWIDYDTNGMRDPGETGTSDQAGNY